MQGICMQIEYCDGCHGRITEHDLSVGLAAWFVDRILCKKCMEKNGLKAPPPVMKVGGRGGASSSGILKAIPGSGIRGAVGSGIRNAVKPGSGIQKAQPGSGILKSQPGSGILRASTNSGGRLAAQPGSGIRNAATPPAGAARSGLLPSAQPATRTTPQAGVRRRKTRARQDGDGGDIWISVVTAILTLLLVAGLFLLLRS